MVGLGASWTLAGSGVAPATVNTSVFDTVRPVVGSVAEAVTVEVPATS